jgi:tetratricopeptide (TPR) repeat protein
LRVARAPLILFMLWKAAATPVAEAVTVIVLPLENLSRLPAINWLSEGVALSLSDQIRSSNVAVIDREQRTALIESLDLPPNAPLSRASMIRVAQQADADRLVMGSYSGKPDNVQLELHLLDVKTLKLGSKINVGGPLTTLPQMENELAWDILNAIGAAAGLSRDRFKERTRTVPNTAYALFVRTLTESDEDQQAKLLSRAVESYPNFPRAQFLLGKYYFQTGDCSKSIPHLQIGLKEQATYLQSEFMLGTCFLRQSLLDEAIQAYSHLLSFVQPHEVLNNIGVAYLRKGDYAIAIQDLIEARKLLPGDATIDLNLAIARFMEGNDSAARELLEQSVKAHPSNGMLAYLFGRVLRRLGEADQSAALMADAKRLGTDPERQDAQDPKTWTRTFSRWEPQGK